MHFETELILHIGQSYKEGIAVDELVDEMTIGLDLTLRDVQSKLKQKAPLAACKRIQTFSGRGKLYSV